MPAAKSASRSRPPAASSAARAKRGGSSSTGRSSARPPRPSGPASPSLLALHRRELIGLGLIVLGVLVGLAVVGVGGAVLVALDIATGALVGIGRFVLPIVLVVIGALVTWGHRSALRPRLAAGSSIIAAVVLGLAHLANGPTDLPGAVDDVRAAGGWIGALVAGPLASVISTPGAAVVLVAVGIGALIVVTGWSIRGIAGGTARRVGPPLSAARRAAAAFTQLDSERQVAGGDATTPAAPAALAGHPVMHVYDVAAEDLAAGSSTAKGAKLLKGDSAGKGRAAKLEQLEIDLGPGVQPGKWKLPPANLLSVTPEQEVDHKAIESRGRILEAALASHGVETRLVGMTVGPTVTRYELELAPGVKVARVTALNKDIAYALAATDVRILAPIPGRSAIGVEVPNNARHLVALGDLMAAPEAKAARQPLEVAIGKDIAGRAVFINLATTPHLLIAGATGAGKSSGLNCIITSLLMRTTPEQVRLILIDPKRVEMGQYNKLPHLLTQVVTSPKKAANALQWAVKEMERRYDLLHEVGVRDVGGYNSAFDRGELRGEPGTDRTYERLPLIVIVVDELNDLMMVAARDVEDSICRIAQMARAVGIHLVIATQRPSVNVITGVIKANIPARMAFAVSSLADSRVILDQQGAERLVGKGDLLLLGPASSVAQRIQGAWVSEEEVRKVTGHWRRQAPEVTYVSGVETAGGDAATGSAADTGDITDAPIGGDDQDDEALVRQAMDLVVRSQLGSTSMLQRKLRIGFARAGRIMDLLEQRGVVGPSEGSKARSVMMTVEELEGLHPAGNH